jgi:hypothetical protein
VDGSNTDNEGHALTPKEESAMQVSESTLQRWFAKDFPDTKISAHPTDYCADCAKYKKLINSYIVSLSRYAMQDVRNEDKVGELRAKKELVEEILANHVALVTLLSCNAQASSHLHYHKVRVQESASEFARINALMERHPNDENAIKEANQFTLAISVDFQMV